MTTHDAGKLNSNPAERRTMTRDPNAPSGEIVESGEKRDGQRVTVGGSTHLTTNIDGKWYVVNSRGEKLVETPFDTESEATTEAQRLNDASTGADEAHNNTARYQQSTTADNQPISPALEHSGNGQRAVADETERADDNGPVVRDANGAAV